LKDGWIWHKTDKGGATIEVCHLNRKELREERHLSESDVKSRATAIWVAHQGDWTDHKFSQEHQFSTYLNDKLKEELVRRVEEFRARLGAFTRNVIGGDGGFELMRSEPLPATWLNGEFDRSDRT
jgi:hypothetical protein